MFKFNYIMLLCEKRKNKKFEFFQTFNFKLWFCFLNINFLWKMCSFEVHYVEVALKMTNGRGDSTAILVPLLPVCKLPVCYWWTADRRLPISTSGFFSKTAKFSRKINYSNPHIGNNLPFVDMVNCHQMWIFYDLKLLTFNINVAVLEKIHKLKWAVSPISSPPITHG